ncbi:MAG: hypothetical protein SOW41_07250, partial [Anaerococcus sp.]|nr:hypothetical protein [Peptoniphilaceae bacterium]MDY3055831.1 hypothetical protein [Anaerococcus sp.]
MTTNKNKDYKKNIDLDSVMKKYDLESNTRHWTGKYEKILKTLLALFSLYCIYVTLFATFLEEIRLTTFLGMIVLLGYLLYPGKKGVQKENHMPLGDIILMVLGSASYFYYSANAVDIINQGTRFNWWQILIGIVAIISLFELARRCVGLPILIVATFFIIYALAYGLTNPEFLGRVKYLVRNLFYTKEGIFSTPI